MFPAQVVEVAISSPDDDRFRTAIRDGLHRWNGASAERRQIILMPATAHDQCDVVIAVFAPGRRTAEHVLRDFVRAKTSGKAVHAWVVTESPSQDLTASDQAWLSDVTKRLAKEGIAPRYIGATDANLGNRVHDAITEDLSDLDLRSPTPQVTTYRSPVPLLGPEICAVTVVNHGASLITDVAVRIDAVDSKGSPLPDGARRSTQQLTDVFGKLRTGPWPQMHDPGSAFPNERPAFPSTRMDVLAAHTTLRFPRWLRPEQHASALYQVEVGASLQVHVQFEDQAGQAWSITNDEEPECISSASGRVRASQESR